MQFLLIGEPDNRVANELTTAGHEVSVCPPGSTMPHCAGTLMQMGDPSEVQVVIWDDGAPARDMAARMHNVSPLPLLACADPSGVPPEHMVGIPLPVDTNTVIATALSRGSVEPAAQYQEPASPPDQQYPPAQHEAPPSQGQQQYPSDQYQAPPSQPEQVMGERLENPSGPLEMPASPSDAGGEHGEHRGAPPQQQGQQQDVQVPQELLEPGASIMPDYTPEPTTPVQPEPSPQEHGSHTPPVAQDPPAAPQEWDNRQQQSPEPPGYEPAVYEQPHHETPPSQPAPHTHVETQGVPPHHADPPPEASRPPVQTQPQEGGQHGLAPPAQPPPQTVPAEPGQWEQPPPHQPPAREEQPAHYPVPPETPPEAPPPQQVDPRPFQSAHVPAQPPPAEPHHRPERPLHDGQGQPPEQEAYRVPAHRQHTPPQEAVHEGYQGDEMPRTWLSPADHGQDAPDFDNPDFGGGGWQDQFQVSGPRGTVITIAAAKGGAGKSTLTLWTAQALSQAGKKVAVVDANIAQADLAKMVGVWSQGRGIQELMLVPDGGRFSKDELKDACVKVEGLGTLLPGLTKPVQAEQERALGVLNQAILQLSTEYEYVLVDSPVATVYEEVFNSLLLLTDETKGPLSDIIVLVINPHNTTAHDTGSWMRDMTTSVAKGGKGYPPDQCVAILNRADDDSEMDVGQLQSTLRNLNLELVAQIPRIDSVIAASNKGLWQCPNEAKTGVQEFVMRLCNVDTGPVVENGGKKKGRLGRLLSLRGGD